MSQNTGVNPFCKTAEISDIQVIGGTMTSAPSGRICFKDKKVIWLAEDPELTIILFGMQSRVGSLVSHSPHSFSNCFTLLLLVSIG